MIIREIKIGELEAFVESREFRQLDPKPVTLIRALSQIRNPRSKKEDTALVIAVEGNTLLGLAGLLPDYISGDVALPVSSNTGWWAHPTLGRHLALPLFARALKACNNRMFLTDATFHTRQILEKTGWFHFAPPVTGKKVIFRFYAGQYIRQKKGSSIFSWSASQADKLLNLALVNMPTQWRKRAFNEMEVSETGAINAQMQQFIGKHNSKEFIRRGTAELEWALGWKWLTTLPSETEGNFPFSWYTRSFHQKILVFRKEGQISGIAVVNIRDGHATIPGFYAGNQEEPLIWKRLFKYLKENKAISCTCYRQGWIDFLSKNRKSYLFEKTIVRHMAVTHELVPLWQKYPEFQDGDGDNIFT